MWRRGKAVRAQAAAPLELCDLCAATFPPSEAVTGYVADSSSAHPTCDWFDGLRRVTACGEPHLAIVRERYRHRPFVREELWAAKVFLALTRGPQVLGWEELGCRTGLDQAELRAAIAWHNERLRHRTDP